MDMKEMNMPTYDEYVEMRDKITDYTTGNLLMTSWSWKKDAVTPGHSAGLCVAEPESSSSFYSCWEFPMQADGKYSDMPKSYLVDPSSWNEESRLNTYEDITMGPFPAMYGGWMCFPPMEMMDYVNTDCMRFLPSPEVSSDADKLFETGPVRAMTYLTTRAEYQTTLVEGNDALTEESGSVFEEFTVDLVDFEGATTAAVGFALATITLLSF